MEQHSSFRTLWISDIHLGSRCCRAEDLIRFLRIVRCQNLYLVGDVVDLLRLKKHWFWTPEHTEVIHQIFAHVRRGAKVLFIPGNHDAAARHFPGLDVGGVEIHKQHIHETANGQRLLITHGDEHDAFVKKSPILGYLGGKAYDGLTAVNRLYNVFRGWFGLSYSDLTNIVKKRFKTVSGYLDSFEESLSETARERECDGVVCGHIHFPRLREDEVSYYNCGDWLESCTALAEREDGSMRILDGLELVAQWDKRVEESALEIEAPGTLDEGQPQRLPIPGLSL